ncbi:unnamed protein product [Absidia cylindrospora]
MLIKSIINALLLFRWWSQNVVPISNEMVSEKSLKTIRIKLKKVETFFSWAIGLETEGIFRLSGSTKRVNTLQQIFDSPQDSYGLHHTWKNYTVHDAGSILRRYFLRLPDPVIPVAFYQRFRDVMNDSMYDKTSQRIDAFQTLICQLPTAHQHLLFYVLDMLRFFATNASVTRMDAANLAAVFSPGLLSHPQHNSPVQYMISQRVIEFLIEYQNLFTMDLLVENEAKPVEPDEALVSPNIHHRRSTTAIPSPSNPSNIPAVPPIPSHWTSSTSSSSSAPLPPPISMSPVQSLLVSPSQSPIPDHHHQQQQQRGILDNGNPVPEAPHDQKNDDNVDIIFEDDMPTPRPGSPVDSLEKHQTPNNALYWKARVDAILRQLIYWWKDVFNPFLLVWYAQLFIIISTIGYEGYMLYGKLAIIEPCLFFSSFLGFGYLLFFGVDFSTTEYNNTDDEDDNDNDNDNDNDWKTNDTAQEETVGKYHIYQDDSDEDEDDVDKSILEVSQGDGDGLSLFDDISLAGESVSEEALLRDKEIMANWQHLMTRSWRAAPTDDDNEFQHPYHEPYPALGNDGHGSQLHVADDGASMLSMASRFNEDDDEDDEVDDDDDDDDLESTTEEDLEQLWARYEQFKQDEELAEKLQQEEQVRGIKMKQHCDGQNPFLQGHGQG